MSVSRSSTLEEEELGFVPSSPISDDEIAQSAPEGERRSDPMMR